MEYQEAVTIIKSGINLVNYKKDNFMHFKFVALNANILSKENKPTIVNLLTNRVEDLEGTSILSVSRADLVDNSILYKTFIRNRDTLNIYKLLLQKLNVDWDSITAKLTNQLSFVFYNGISLEVFLAIVQIKALLGFDNNNLTSILNIFDNLSLYDILCNLFECQKLTLVEYKNQYAKLLQLRSLIEEEQINQEWADVTREFPETDNEISFMKKRLENITKLSIYKFSRVRENRVKNNWKKIIKISRNCWPANLQPNLFNPLLSL